MPGAQPGRPTLRRHETEEELLYYQDLQAISGDTLDNIGVYLSYRHTVLDHTLDDPNQGTNTEEIQDKRKTCKTETQETQGQ